MSGEQRHFGFRCVGLCRQFYSLGASLDPPHTSAQSAAGGDELKTWVMKKSTCYTFGVFLSITQRMSDFLRLHEQKLFGSYDMHSQGDSLQGVAASYFFWALSGQSCSSHLMCPPVYLTVQTHSPNCNMINS